METREITTEVLNDLVRINNDRVAGYERAIKELKDEDADLKELFRNMMRESQTYKMELATEISAAGADTETGTTNSGKIYRAWMDVKAAFTGHDRKSVLSNCEFGEDAAQKAYNTALSEANLPAYLHTLIAEQKQKLKQSHDRIKALRDSA